jgi:DNA-binding transcriptional LysR family regulator
MDIAALQAFVAVADCGSFSRGAEQVHLTQPAVSKRIAALEDELGARLFDRAARKALLTPAGQALLPQARAILSEIGEAKRRIANLAGAVSGPLSLGTSYHIGLHRLRPALSEFTRAYPEVHLDLRFMDSEAACRAVADDALELAVVTLPDVPIARLRIDTLWDDPLDVVVSPHHPLAAPTKVVPDDLLRHPAILPAAGTFTREIIVTALSSIGAKLDVGIETNNLDVIKMLVAIGLGWSALPRSLIDDELKVVHIEGIAIRRELGVVTHAGRTPSNAARAMIGILGRTT